MEGLGAFDVEMKPTEATGRTHARMILSKAYRDDLVATTKGEMLTTMIETRGGLPHMSRWSSWRGTGRGEPAQLECRPAHRFSAERLIIMDGGTWTNESLVAVSEVPPSLTYNAATNTFWLFFAQ